MVSPHVELSAEEFDLLTLSLLNYENTPVPGGWGLVVQWKTAENSTFSEERQVSLALGEEIGDLVVAPLDHPQWKGRITQFRYSLPVVPSGSTSTLVFDWIRLEQAAD